MSIVAMSLPMRDYISEVIIIASMNTVGYEAYYIFMYILCFLI